MFLSKISIAVVKDYLEGFSRVNITNQGKDKSLIAEKRVRGERAETNLSGPNPIFKPNPWN